MSGQLFQSLKAGMLAIELSDNELDKDNIAVGLGNIGHRQIVVGAFQGALET